LAVKHPVKHQKLKHLKNTFRQTLRLFLAIRFMDLVLTLVASRLFSLNTALPKNPSILLKASYPVWVLSM
jgi:hypothetical protein